jgi:hypothetical protein
MERLRRIEKQKLTPMRKEQQLGMEMVMYILHKDLELLMELLESRIP